MAQELISSEAKEKKKRKKRKSNKKHRKNDMHSHDIEMCSCESPENCEIKPFIEQLTQTLISEAVKKVGLESSKKKSKNKKYKKKNSAKNNSTSSNPPLFPDKSFMFEPSRESLEKQEETSKGSDEKIKEDFSLDLKKSQSCDITNLENFQYLNKGEDFIEVKSKKDKNTNKQMRFPIKLHKNLEKNNKTQSKFNKQMSENKKTLIVKEKTKKENDFLEINATLSTSSLPSKKKTSLDENITKDQKPIQSQSQSTSSNKQQKHPHAQPDYPTKKAEISHHNHHHYLDSELEKELKNPPSIHLSKSNKQRKEENSSRTISTKGIDTGETTSPSQKTKKSSSLNAIHFPDEPLLEINLINIEEFRYENLEDAEDQAFVEKVNLDMNEFLNEMQEDAPHIMNYRSIMFQRLLFIVSNIFSEYQPNLRLYGSCATGLALSTSDMDIGITGFETLTTYESTEILQVLLSKLTFLKWVKTYKPIFTASIPVLKLVYLI